MMLPGELEAIRKVIDYAEQYGYGNLIGHLRQQWALKIVNSYGKGDWNFAVRSTNSAPYPQDWFPELRRP